MSTRTRDPGAIVLTGEQIPKARILVLRAGLKLEMHGMRMSRGRTAYSIIKSEFGFKGNRARVLFQLNDWIKENIFE